MIVFFLEIYKNGIQKDAGYNREFSVQLDDDRRNEQTVNQDEPIVNLDPVSSFLSLADRFLKCFDFYANFTKILSNIMKKPIDCSVRVPI